MKRYLMTVALFAAGVLLIGSQAMAQAGPPGGLGVNVINTPLSVTVTNPTVPPSTVNVGNADTIAAAIAAANKQAAGTPVAFTLRAGAFTYSVPVGQRLVIEYMAGSNNSIDRAGAVTCAVSVTTNGVGNTFLFRYRFSSNPLAL